MEWALLILMPLWVGLVSAEVPPSHERRSDLGSISSGTPFTRGDDSSSPPRIGLKTEEKDSTWESVSDEETGAKRFEGSGYLPSYIANSDELPDNAVFSRAGVRSSGRLTGPLKRAKQWQKDQQTLGKISSNLISTAKLNINRPDSQCDHYTFPQPFQSEQFALVDSAGSNYLFRSNLPLGVHGEFAKADILHAVAKITGKKSDPKVEIVVYSLLLPYDLTYQYGFDEYCEARAEEAAATSNVQIKFHGLVGTKADPYRFSEWERHVRGRNLARFEPKLQHIVDSIRQDLLKPAPQPKYIIFHCHFGKDRTGAVAAAYKMTYLRKSLSEVRLENVGYGQDSQPYINLMTWYCYYLEANNKVVHSLECGEQ